MCSLLTGFLNKEAHYTADKCFRQTIKNLSHHGISKKSINYR